MSSPGPIPVHVRFSPTFASLSEHALWAEPPLCLRRSDGTLDVRGCTANPDLFLGWVLLYGLHANLLSPMSLQHRLVNHLHLLLDHHLQASHGS